MFGNNCWAVSVQLDRSSSHLQNYNCVFFSVVSLRQDEVAAMSGPDEFGEFYHRLRQIKDHHRKNPNEIEEPMQMEFLRMESERQKPPEDMQSGLAVVILSTDS